ncbi:MAG: hypothetical protein ACXWMN_06615, partial [Candidatus Limnocylindria bacterium]
MNVVRFGPGGRLAGFNTDVIGIERTLQEQGARMKGQSALILGAGGGALAAGYVLGRQGAREVLIANRTIGRAREVARKLSRLFKKTRFRATTLEQTRNLPPLRLCVNATPVGMEGFPARSLLPNGVGRGTL